MATFSIEPTTLAIVAVSPMWCGLMTLKAWRAGEAMSRAGRAPPCDEE
jgi:hypothetical protein